MLALRRNLSSFRLLFLLLQWFILILNAVDKQKFNWNYFAKVKVQFLKFTCTFEKSIVYLSMYHFMRYGTVSCYFGNFRVIFNHLVIGTLKFCQTLWRSVNIYTLYTAFSVERRYVRRIRTTYEKNDWLLLVIFEQKIKESFNALVYLNLYVF